MKSLDKSLRSVIAERRLHPLGAPRRKVLVSLGRPRKTRGHDDWECPFRITGAGLRLAEYGRGVDAFQALTMALEGIRYFLDRSGTPLAWSGVFEDQTGFQRLIPLLPEAADSKRIERLVDGEVQRWAERMKRRYLARARARKRRSKPVAGGL